MIRAPQWVAVAGLAAQLAACEPAGTPVPGRWYTAEQVAQGGQVFAAQCAGCHGLQAQGTPDWRRRDAAGQLPPPPLDGSAHAWHHARDELRDYILGGGVPLGGSMPGFRGLLTDAEVLAAIAWFQSRWPDEIYSRWAQMHPPGDAR